MQRQQEIRHKPTLEERLAAEKAAEFEQLAGATQDPVRQARFSNIAGFYRLLAREREWLIENGAVEVTRPARRPRRGTMGMSRS
jgi:hypothetical protein